MELVPHRPRSPLFLHRNFALLWGGQAVSYIGDLVFDTTLVLWIATRLGAHHAWAPLGVSGMLLAVAVPQIVIGPLAGVFVDRWDKRWTLLRMDAIRAVLILLLIPTTGPIALPLWAQLGAIYTVVGANTICAQFFGPARLALLSDLVVEPDRTRASSLLQLTSNLASVVGPSLAAPLYFEFGARWALLINTLSFAISFIAIALIRGLASSEQVVRPRYSLRQEFGAGLRFFAGNRVLVSVMISGMLVMLGYGAVTTLNVFFLQENLHAAVRWYGLVGAASGAGALVGSMLVGVLGTRLEPFRMLWVAVLIVGGLHLVYARLSSLPAALAVLFLVGLFAAAVNVALLPVVLRVTPREFVGRVAAVLGPAISLASMISVALAGYLASTLLRGFHATVFGLKIGPIDTIFTMTGLLELVSGVYAMFNLRDVPSQGSVHQGG